MTPSFPTRRSSDLARRLYRLMTPAFHLDTHVKLVQYIKLAEQVAYGAPEWIRAPRLPLIGEERESVLTVLNATVDALAGRTPGQAKRPAWESPRHGGIGAPPTPPCGGRAGWGEVGRRAVRG